MIIVAWVGGNDIIAGVMTTGDFMAVLMLKTIIISLSRLSSAA